MGELQVVSWEDRIMPVHRKPATYKEKTFTSYCQEGEHFYCQIGDVGRKAFEACACSCHKEEEK